MAEVSPVLVPFLRAALIKLYSIPVDHHNLIQHNVPLSHFPTEKEAHEFLLGFQSRNLRRQMRSLEQRRRDRDSQNLEEDEGVDGDQSSMEVLQQRGSVWIACVYLLCQPPTIVHSSEKMFAAQTLLHRLRRMSLTDAVDIEVESWQLLSLCAPPKSNATNQSSNTNINGNHNLYIESLLLFYKSLMPQCHELLQRMVLQLDALESQQHSLNFNLRSHLNDEDYIKGALTTLLLPSLSIISACEFSAPAHEGSLNDRFNYLNPIITTLGAAHSTSIIRLKYAVEYLDQSKPCRIAIPMIYMLNDSIQLASNLKKLNHEHFSPIQSQHYDYMIAKITCISLSTLPETIFSSAMSITRGRFSIDPRCIHYSAQELRSNTSTGSLPDNRTGIFLYQKVLQDCLTIVTSSTNISSNNGSSSDNQQFILDMHKTIFMASERWVNFLPINQEFFSWLHPMLSAHLQQSNPYIQSVHEKEILISACQNQVYQFLTALLDAASLTPDEIVASLLGLSDMPNASSDSSKIPSNNTRNKFSISSLMKSKKNKSAHPTASRAKQRRKDKLNNAITASPHLIKQAMQEHIDRKEMACFAVHCLFQDLDNNLKKELQFLHTKQKDPTINTQSNRDVVVDGEGIIGCASSCAKACLPHLLSSIFQRRPNFARKNNMNVSLVIPDDENNNEQVFSEEDKGKRRELFQKIMTFCFQICGCAINRSVRMFSFEVLMALHLAVLDIEINDFNNIYSEDIQKFYDIVVDNLYQCAMSLATSCAYPPNYFADMALDSDEEVENERNDVRDVIRCITTIPDNCQNIAEMIQHSSIKIIHRLVHACLAETTKTKDIIPQSHQTFRLTSETVVHALSALAKPLSKLVSRIHFLGETAVRILSIAMEALGNICQELVIVFEASASSSTAVDPTTIFPVSRLASIGTASFGRTFASILDITSMTENGGGSSSGVSNVSTSSMMNLRHTLKRTIDFSMKAASLSVKYFPELMALSTLDNTIYDIRGAMRGPGGEDHVGCLALKRVIHENDKLANFVLCSFGEFSQKDEEGPKNEINCSYSLISTLCQILEQLKQQELSRGRNVLHGQGVTPKSRRILLHTVSQLGIISMNHVASNSDQSKIHAEFNQTISSTMQQLFHSPLVKIMELSKLTDSKDEVEIMFQACECAFDLAAFAPEMTNTLFNSDAHKHNPIILQGMQLLFDLLIMGYTKFSSQSLPSSNISEDLCIQWGRLRCALLSLFRSSASNHRLPTLALEAIIKINQVECEAASRHCSIKQATTSSLMFNDEVIGENMLSAGAFIIVISEVLDKLNTLGRREDSEATFIENTVVEKCQDSILSLHQTRDFVFSLIMMSNTDISRGSDIDPRPTITEAWYLSMHSLISLCLGNNCVAPCLLGAQSVQDLLSDSCCVAVLLLFMKQIGKQNSKSDSNNNMVIEDGMNMDAPQTLALLQFLEAVLFIGPEFLGMVGAKLKSKLKLKMEFGDNRNMPSMIRKTRIDELSPQELGGALIGASLLRATSGALPPWAVEGMAKLFAALYVGIGENDKFSSTMAYALELRLDMEKGCDKLGGKYVNNLGVKGKDAFLATAEEAARLNNGSGWRKFKVALKAACGGKKKMSGFNLKPSFTSWECDRV